MTWLAPSRFPFYAILSVVQTGTFSLAYRQYGSEICFIKRELPIYIHVLCAGGTSGAPSALPWCYQTPPGGSQRARVRTESPCSSGDSPCGTVHEDEPHVIPSVREK